MENKSTKIRIIVFAVIVIGIVIVMSMIAGGGKISANYTSFAQCLKDKGTQFYGAFWCPHCQAQERSFGMSRDQLAGIGLYQECATPDGNGQTQLCIDKNIESYPTWVFADGTRVSGEQTFKTLSEKSGCALPASSVENPISSSASSATQ